MIKSFKIFESNYLKKSSIKSICKEYLSSDEVISWEINKDGLVDVEGDVHLDYGNLGNLKKLPLKFGKVTGDFFCHQNELISLEGSPQWVGGDFYCQYNKLVSLVGGPQSVGGDFSCNNNRLISLKGCPQKINGFFDCHKNKLTTLSGGPQSVGSGFHCDNNELVSLKGSPQSVGGSFNCSDNQIRDFLIPYGSLNESKEFNCEGNPIWEIYRLFNTPKCIDLFDEFGGIGDVEVSWQVIEEIWDILEIQPLSKNYVKRLLRSWKLV
jgi:hypothetical protein